MMDDEPERMDPRCDAGGRGYMLWMEYCSNDGEYVRATDYDALAARLAEVEAERDAFASNIPDAAQNLIRNAHTGRLKALHRAKAAEAERDAAMRAVDENWITHQRVVAAEAALPAVYQLVLEDAAAYLQEQDVDLGPWSETIICSVLAEEIRALPTPTAAELMARIQTGEKE